MNRFAAACLFVLCPAAADSARAAEAAAEWLVGDPVLRPGPEGSIDEVAVKDPTVVFFEETWHLFYTAAGKSEYTTAYVSAKRLEDLRNAPRRELTMIRGKTRYGCAPQVFFFQPQGKWYLIYQSRDANYQPMFSTTTTIARPETWNAPFPLIRKDSARKWIDFWVICDAANAYLFYTEGHRDVVVRSTCLVDFPDGWGEPKKAFTDVHEAVHVYRVKNEEEFHMIYERNHEGVRSFGLAVAQTLEGPWKKATDRYATGKQLKFVGEGDPWTEMVSHGEAIRSGYDQNLRYEPTRCCWLIQGILKKELGGPYPSLPWRLGVIGKAPK